ncbi:hypothetical protein F4780DRAFT_772809 [Xylariomycetidae sp. FL0641]|nr:hypothetical protein F4780DRAFT_772809 [Xylariomycetidae sp. FL0641]
MSTKKRRKLDIAESSQPLSAFALRKRLLASRSSADAPTPDTTLEASPVLTTDNDGIQTEARSPKKTRTSRRANQEPPLQESADQVLTPPPQVLQAPTPESAALRSPGNSPDLADEKVLQEPLVVQLSSFKPTKANFKRKRGGNISLRLTEGERLVILGNYGIVVEAGEITICGATLSSSKKVYWVDAPHCHALPVIRCSENAALDIRSNPAAEDLRNLGRLSPLFKKLWNEDYSPSSQEKSHTVDPTFQILYTSADGPKKMSIRDLVSPPEWNKEMARVLKVTSAKPGSIMITGPKSSGKSTFGKILANRLITSGMAQSKQRTSGGVAILDLDPGQPEYCIAGQVALVHLTQPVLGPSFCRPQSSAGIRLVRSHALASITPAADPELFLEAATDLLSHYRNALGSCPLIINTPGWIQGTGLDLLVALITSVRPSEVIYMSQLGPVEAVEALQEASKGTGFSLLPSQPTQCTSRSAAQFRSMQAMSYFHAASQPPGSVEPLPRWSPQPLTSVPPWLVNYTGADRGVVGVMCYDYQAPGDLLCDAINGTILAVVVVENSKAFREPHPTPGSKKESMPEESLTSQMDIDDSRAMDTPSLSQLGSTIASLTPEDLPFLETPQGTTLDPRYSRSLGLVLVRGIDKENGQLQLITPILAESFEELEANGGEIVLVSGKFDTPSWAYTEDAYNASHEEADESSDEEEMGIFDGSQLDEFSGTQGSKKADEAQAIPWIEVLERNAKRHAGSKVWRVRRDLGRDGK